VKDRRAAVWTLRDMYIKPMAGLIKRAKGKKEKKKRKGQRME
jgi:hypothetical protein